MAKIAKEKAEIKIAPNQKPEKKKRKYTKKKSLQVSNNSLVAVDPQLIILKAIEKDLDLDKMERLLVMRRELKAENAKDMYYKNLAKFQKECPVIKKENPVYEKNSKVVRYTYAKIEDILAQGKSGNKVKDMLEKYGFSYSFKTEQENGNLTTICISFHELGHKEETNFTIPIDRKSFMSDPQKIAAASTFSKRYAFCNAFGIMTADEDNDAIQDDKPGKGKKLNQSSKTPAENNKLYCDCINIIQEDYKGFKLFTKTRIVAQMKAINAVKNNMEKLSSLRESLKAFVDVEKKKIDNQKSGDTGELFEKPEKNITNISDYQKVDPEAESERIRKELIRLISSKKADGKNVFSSEEMIKYKRAGDEFLNDGKLQDALNVIEIITEIKEKRTGKKEKNNE